MVKRITVDKDSPQAVAKLWRSNEGREVTNKAVTPGQKPCVCYVRLSEFLSEEDRAALSAAIQALHPSIEEVELQTEVDVPELADHDWSFHMVSHLIPRAVAEEPAE